MVDSTAESRSDTQAGSERSSPGAVPSAPLPPRSMGRRVGIIVYWVFITFVIGSGVRSITTQVFWPRADAAPPAATCGAGIRALASELRTFAADRAARPSEAPPNDRAFFGAWDARQHALESLCEGEAARSAYVSLARYRFSLEQSLVRHLREETVLSRDLDARLAALRP